MLLLLLLLLGGAVAGSPMATVRGETAEEQKAIAAWEKTVKMNPQSVGSVIPMLELAERLRRAGQIASPPEQGNPQIERAIELCERAVTLEPDNGLTHLSLSLALKEGAKHFRQSDQSKGQELWGRLSDLVSSQIQAKKLTHDPIVTSARKWRDFAKQLRPKRGKNNDKRCLGRDSEWALDDWKHRQDAKRIDASDAAQAEAVRTALETGGAEPVILTGGPKHSTKLDEVFSKSSEQLVEVTITHDKGLALKFDSIAPWKRNRHVDHEYTAHNAMNDYVRSEAAAHGGVSSKVVIRGAFTHMLFGDFLAMASEPAFKKGESKPSRPNLYLVAGNLQVYMPTLGAHVLGGELSDGAAAKQGGELPVFDRLLERFRTMQGKSHGRHELNLWMG